MKILITILFVILFLSVIQTYNILTLNYEADSLKLDNKIKAIQLKNMDILYECNFDERYICSKLHKAGYPKLIK